MQVNCAKCPPNLFYSYISCMIGLKKFNYIVWFLKTDLELKQTKQDKKVQKTGHYVNLFLLTN